MVRHLDISVTKEELEARAIEITCLVRPEWSQCSPSRDTTQVRSEICIKTFTDGITNRLVGCFLSENPDDVLLIRIYGEKTELFIDRKIEIRNMKLMNGAGLSPPLLASFNNGICYGFTPGSVISYDMAVDDTISGLIAAKLAKMHSVGSGRGTPCHKTTSATLVNNSPNHLMKISTPERKIPSLFKVLKRYLQLVPVSFNDPLKNHRLKSEVPSIKELESEVSYLEILLTEAKSPVVFCHNDLLLKNIIYHKDHQSSGGDDQDAVDRMGVTFIDFEYADFNFQAFDISNHFCEFAGVDDYDPSKYPDVEFQLKWLRNYLKNWKKSSSSLHNYTNGSRHNGSNYLIDDSQDDDNDESSDHDVKVLLDQVRKFTLAAHLFWGIWALIQWEHSTLDFDFLKYALQRINQYFIDKSKLIKSSNGHS